MKKKKKIKCAVIYWDDASYEKGPLFQDDMDHDLWPLTTIGMVAKETKKSIKLSLERADSNECYRYTVTIPKVLIKKKKYFYYEEY